MRKKKPELYGGGGADLNQVLGCRSEALASQQHGILWKLTHNGLLRGDINHGKLSWESAFVVRLELPCVDFLSRRDSFLNLVSLSYRTHGDTPAHKLKNDDISTLLNITRRI